MNMVASQSEDNRIAIIQFVTSEMRKSQTSFCVDFVFGTNSHVNEMKIT